MDEKEYSQAEEIAAYYKRLENEEEKTEPSAQMPIESETEDEIISEEDFEAAPKKNKAFIAITALAAAVIILVSFFFGCFSAKPGKGVDGVYLRLLKTDDKYLNAYQSSEDTARELEDINRELAGKRKEADDLAQFVEQQAQIQQKIYELQEEYTALEKKTEDKEKTLRSLENQAEKKAVKKVTLSPGIYSVGKHIAEGAYTITGNGSFNLSDGAGGFKQNAMLTGEETECVISDGDLLKLETTAVFERKVEQNEQAG